MARAGLDWHGWELAAASRAQPVCSGGILYNSNKDEPVFKTPGRARAAIWSGIALFTLGVAGTVLLANVDTGDSGKTITLWIVVVKLVLCGAVLAGVGAWRLRRLTASG